MSNGHAPLGPSSAARWIACPASVRLAGGLPDDSSEWAIQGTAAHAYAEIIARRELLGIHRAADLVVWARDYREHFEREAFEDMQRHVAAYVEVLRERLSAAGRGAELLLEQRVDTGIPGCWGTADAVILSPEAVEVVDLKYGAGVRVYAEGNPQLMLYGVGALDTLDVLGEARMVGMTIFQPRAGDGKPSRWTIAADELRQWRDGLRPVAAEALAGSDRFQPTPKGCQFCKAAPTCKPFAQEVMRAAFAQDADDFDPADPPELNAGERLTPDDTGRLLAAVPLVKAWVTKIEADSLDRLTRGESIPGWKAVRSGGRRTITDPAEAVRRLVALGFDRDEVVESKPAALGKLERLVGKSALAEALDGVLVKGEGAPTMVPESDPRDSIALGLAAFADDDDDPE